MGNGAMSWMPEHVTIERLGKAPPMCGAHIARAALLKLLTLRRTRTNWHREGAISGWRSPRFRVAEPPPTLTCSVFSALASLLRVRSWSALRTSTNPIPRPVTQRPARMLPAREALTFDVLDDLVLAHERGRTPA